MALLLHCCTTSLRLGYRQGLLLLSLTILLYSSMVNLTQVVRYLAHQKNKQYETLLN